MSVKYGRVQRGMETSLTLSARLANSGSLTTCIVAKTGGLSAVSGEMQNRPTYLVFVLFLGTNS